MKLVLIHGLGRTYKSWRKVRNYFSPYYQIMDIDYPSLFCSMDKLVENYVKPILDDQKDPVQIITHSMGGILLRHYLKDHSLPEGSRVVMLAPPNHGSEVIDFLRMHGLHHFVGPAAKTLTTDMDIGPASEEIGIIAASWSNIFTGSMFFREVNDGKVSVESTKLEGMTDHIVMPCSHTFIMNKDDVLDQVWHFFKYGRFER